MATYEFHCNKCNRDFEMIMTITEFEDTKVKCPECGDDNVDRIYSSFYTKTSKKS